MRLPHPVLLSLAIALASAGSASADPQSQPPPQPAAAAEDDPDLSPAPMQPDFYLVNLPTSLRLPRHKFAFRVTHRFTRPLDQGDFLDSLSDLFGLDSGAQIGLELRFSPIGGGQLGIYRTNDKTIDLFASYNVLRSVAGVPVSVTATTSVEGANNFQEDYSASVGAVASADVADRLAFLLAPTWVSNTNQLAAGLAESDHTFYLGIGLRLRMTRTSYFVAEVSPRLAGFMGGGPDPLDPTIYVEGRQLMSFAVEKTVGGHVFQLNFSNGFATTPANIARGAASGKTNWYLGFNISRKFY
jgi:hypothetical protein